MNTHKDIQTRKSSISPKSYKLKARSNNENKNVKSIDTPEYRSEKRSRPIGFIKTQNSALKKIKTLHGTTNSSVLSDVGKIVLNTDVFSLVLQTQLDSIGRAELLGNFNLNKSIDEVKKLHNDFIVHLGIEFGTKKYKKVQHYCIQLMEGIKNPEHPDRLSTGAKDFWPNCIGSIRPLYHQVRDKGPYRIVGDQIIRSLFAMQRTVEDFSQITLDKIEYEAKVDKDFLNRYTEFCINKYKEYGLYETSLKEGVIDDYIITPPISIEASGPNGVKKSWSAGYEASALVVNKELMIPITNICKITKNEKFLTFINHMAKEYNRISSEERIQFPEKTDIGKKDKHSRNVKILNPTCLSVDSVYTSTNIVLKDKAVLRLLVSVPDKGNKSRTVAIPDYFTQCLLTPFDKIINDTIKVFYPTCSNISDHEGGFDKLVQSIRIGTVCTDAESWTDTFSTKFQEVHVKALFGGEFSTEWQKLVCRCKWSVKGSNNSIYYKTGQGMGTKGSFSIASLAYLTLFEFLIMDYYPHLITSTLPKTEKLVGVFNGIGDDTWCQDPEGKVLKALTELAGIPVNISKSKFATKENLVGEYVSRNLNYGNDVSRISSSICRNVGQNIFYLTNLFIHINERTEGFPWNSFINKLMLLQNSKGKLIFLCHIWAGYYRSLVIDRIIRDDNAFSPLLIAMESNLDLKDESYKLLGLRDRLGNPKRLTVFKIQLMLIECEYIYSRIIKATKSCTDFLKGFPFGTITKHYNKSYFEIDFLKNMSSLDELTLLYIYSKIKLAVDPMMFKLSLDSSLPQSNLNQILSAAEGLRNELIPIYDTCFFEKRDRKVDQSIKNRMDRSFNIQKQIVNGIFSQGKDVDKCINYLPNMELLFEMESKDFLTFCALLDDRDYGSPQPNLTNADNQSIG
jgi:hypothetical protein